MKIDGRHIASTRFADLTSQISLLTKKGISPHLVVILVGEDPASISYVRQKKLKGEAIGMKVTVITFPKETSETNLLQTVTDLNSDDSVHGIIIQQPLPKHVNPNTLIEATDPRKDVDGFHTDSLFTPPIAEAAIEILSSVHSEKGEQSVFTDWLKNQKIVIIGKGETGGAPIKEKLTKLGATIDVIDSKTEDPKAVTKNADIIISCVGRSEIVKRNMIKKGAMLLSVGMFRGQDGKLHGDYDEEEIKDVAGFYTPVPGGMGPVNVAMLLKNVITAASSSKSS